MSSVRVFGSGTTIADTGAALVGTAMRYEAASDRRFDPTNEQDTCDYGITPTGWPAYNNYAALDDGDLPGGDAPSDCGIGA